MLEKKSLSVAIVSGTINGTLQVALRYVEQGRLITVLQDYKDIDSRW